MADTCCAYAVAGITINATTGDCLHTDWDDGDIQGLDGAPVRKQIDLLGQTNGGLVQPAFFAPRIITFSGRVLIRTVEPSDKTAYVGAVNAVIDGAVTALQSFLNSTTTLAWTETGGGAHSITVTYGTEGGEFQSSGPMLDKKWSFTLVAADPTIS